MLIAGFRDPSIPPNLPPEWISQPTPSFIALEEGTYDFSQNCTDPENDTITYTLNAGSTALPSGFDLSSAGVLTADGTQTSGNTSGIIIDSDDGINAAVASSAFTIAVTVQSNSSPTLFDDIADNAISGCAGALEPNDDWESTVYEYIPQYAPTVGAIPTPTTGAALPTSNGVNPNAADEYFCFDDSAVDGFAAVADDNTYRVVFCVKGNDMSDGTNNDQLNMSSAGTGSSGTPRWFVFYDPDGTIDVETFAGHPINQAYADRVQMPYMFHEGCNYIRYVGLSWGVIGGQVQRQFMAESNSSHNLFYRCNAENGTSHVWNSRDAASTDNYVYQCTSHDHDATGNDIHCHTSINQTNMRVISCEMWNMRGDAFHNVIGTGGIVEDCDMYSTSAWYQNQDGTPNPSGDYQGGEGGVDLKDVSGTTSRVYGNRFWGYKKVSQAHTGGGNASAIAFSMASSGWTGSTNVDIRWNIIHNCNDGALALKNNRLEDPALDQDAIGNISIVRNIIGECHSQRSSIPCLYINLPDVEFYLNTVSDTDQGVNTDLLYNWTDAVSTHDRADYMGNFITECGVFFNESFWGTNFYVGYNAYAETAEVAEAGYSTSNYGSTGTTRASLNMGDFKYRRKKLTVDGGEIATIPGIVPRTSTPAGFKTLVPTSGGTGNDQIGSRTGIGVDDNF